MVRSKHQHQTISPVEHPDLQLLLIPHAQPYTALAFSIQQIGSDGKDKIRRGEDWRRSGRNPTCIMHEQPFHHTPDHFTTLALLDHSRWPHHPIHVWRHDHDGAYRQLPRDDPRLACVLLITPSGPTLEPQRLAVRLICQRMGIQPIWGRQGLHRQGPSPMPGTPLRRRLRQHGTRSSGYLGLSIIGTTQWSIWIPHEEEQATASRLTTQDPGGHHLHGR